MVLPHDHKGKSDIVVEMSPITRTKVFPAHTGSLTNFGEFAVLVYYEVMKLASNYDRADLIFDQYFKKSLKEGTRSGRGEGSQYLLKGILLESFTKWLRVSSKTTKTRIN